MLKDVMLLMLFGHIPLLAFIAGAVSTEVLIILSALAGAGNSSIWLVFLFGLLGEVFHDTVFFYLAKTNFIKWVNKKLKLSKGRNRIAELIEKTAYRGYFLPIFLAKFIYGVRDGVILYVGHKEKNFRKYFIACISASIISLAIFVGLGWLAGKGIIALSIIYGGIEKIIGLILIAVIIVYIAYRIVGKIVLRIYDNSLKRINSHIKRIDKKINNMNLIKNK